MNAELGSILENAFLARKKGHVAVDLNRDMLVPGERRDVAVLFLDLSGFTAFSETLDHETVHDITKSLMDELVFTAGQYSGYVDKIEGDRIMVLFGAIRSAENNSRSSILCGFKMLEVVEIAGSILSNIGVNLSARIGINNGPVTVAPDAIGHLTAMGNTVNIASRMEENAEENSVLVTNSVYSNCSENFRWDKPSELTVKGIAIPVHTWKPVSVSYKRNPAFCPVSVRTVFVAREKEYSLLTQVRKMQRDNASGKNRMGGARHLIVELKGEAGTGKTRLVSEYLKNESVESNAIVLRGYSVQDAQPAHWLWSTVLQNLLDLQTENSVSYDDFVDSISRCCHSGNLAGALPFLGRLVSAPADHIDLKEMGNKAIATETKMAVRDLIESLSEDSPVVVILEDLQWMDSTDAEVLDFIVKNCYSVSPVIFLLIRRSDHNNLLPEDICKSSAYAKCHKITLDELTVDETTDFTEKFMQKLSGANSCSVSSKAMEFINRHSSGNPFFLQELILHLVESGGLSIVNETWILTHSSVELSTPGSLTGLLQSRLDRLPDLLRKTLLNCSVFGMEFRYETYKSVELKLGIEPCGKDVFNQLVERQFLEKTASDQGISFVFHHSFIQRTAYNSILSHNLRVLHKTVAESMEEIFGHDTKRVSAKLAEHWERAGIVSSAVDCGITAQKFASQNYQYDAVLKWGKRIDGWLSPCGEDTKELLKLLAVLHRSNKALLFTHKWKELDTLLNRMHRIASSNSFDEWLARTEMAMGEHFTAIRDMDSALDHLQRSLVICRDFGYEEIESDVLCSLGVISGMHREFAQAKEYFERAKDLFSNQQNLKGKARALGNLGILYRNTGEIDQAIILLKEILEIFRQIGDVRNEAVTLGNLGSLYLDRKEITTGEDHFKKAIEIFHRLGDRMPEGVFLCNLGNSFREKGLFDPAEAAYSEAMTIIEEIGDKRTSAWIMSNHALQYIFQDRLEESGQLFSRALSIFTEIGDEENMAVAISGSGYIKYLSGKKELSLEAYLKANEIISRMKLRPTDFSETFIKLRRGLLDDQFSEASLPWPEHWEESDK